MKTPEQILARIAECEEQREYWRKESASPAAKEDSHYREYCLQNTSQFAFEITGLMWVLDLPIV